MNVAIGRSVRAASIVGVMTLAMLGPVSAAQDSANIPHPAHIHSGTCAQLGDVVAPLKDVAEPEGDHQGAASAFPLETSETIVDMSLQDLLDGNHAVNVHKSADEINVYIACGDIGGVVNTDEGGRTELVVALGELNDSGYYGVASIGSDEGSDQTEVSVTLIEPGAMISGNTTEAQAATPASVKAATEAAVSIKDFAFHPDSITVPAGGSITWTNDDTVPHTATGNDRSVLQSGTIKPGESFTQTFDTAGSYDYFCEFHAGMKGKIVVE
jgi:plastocyanin